MIIRAKLWKNEVNTISSNVALLIVEHFAANPFLTTNRIAEELKISYSTAQRGIQRLEEAKIIKQINNSKRERVYCATEVLAILEAPTYIPRNFQNG